MAQVAIKIEAEFLGRGNGWTDISFDVLSPLSIGYGIRGAGATDRTASSGSCNLIMDNSTSNSAGLLGYYSSGSQNARGGWTIGIRVRVSLQDPADSTWYVRFIGSIVSIEPVAGRYGPRRVSVVVTDWMDEAARARLSGVETQINKRSDEIVSTLIANVSRAPEAQSIGTGLDTYAYALDTARDGGPILQELARVVNSELGFLYQRGNGTVVYEPRNSRVSTSSAYSFDNTMSGLQYSSSRDALLSEVRATISPRTVDAAAVVLYSLTTATQIQAGQTVEIEGGYSDPSNRAVRVGGTSMVTPVATTDYTANSQADGLGTDYTASLTVTATYSSNAASYSLTNTAGVAIYVTKLQARGIGIYEYQPITATATDATIATSYGDSVIELSMPYQADFRVGSDAAQYLLGLYGTTEVGVWYLGTVGASELGQHTQLSYEVQRSVGSVLLLPKTAALQTQILVRDIGDRIAISETVTGLDASNYYIQAVDLSIAGPGIVSATWLLSPADSTAYWRLGTTNFSELGTNTYLSYS